MNPSIRIFYWGAVISFLGSLPPGVMNIAGMQMATTSGVSNAFIYSAGFIAAEVLLVVLSLSGMNRLTQNKKIFRITEWIVAALLILFSIICFVGAGWQKKTGDIPELILPPFITGIIVSLINPVHLPFWITWNNFLFKNGALTAGTRQYTIYVTGIATGTLAGISVYIYGGQHILKVFLSNQYLINWIMGMVLLIAGLVHLKKIIPAWAAMRQPNIFHDEK